MKSLKDYTLPQLKQLYHLLNIAGVHAESKDMFSAIMWSAEVQQAIKEKETINTEVK